MIIVSLFIGMFNQGFLEAGTNYRRKGHLPIKKVGDVGQVAVPLLAACVVFAHKDVKGVQAYASSFAATMGVSYIIKPTINAKRPNGGKMSFPSGHTAAAMGGAAFLQMRYGWMFGVPSYLAAAYVGFSRVYAQKHWLRDVLGATTIAVASTAFFTSPYSEKSYQFIPIIERDRAGIAVRWEW